MQTLEIGERTPSESENAQGSLAAVTAPLLAWYASHRRELPWRREPTPYRVWISEIMLQQTRSEAVKPYFDRFVSELPDVRSLSEVGEDRLLKLWEGLGYYQRARNLKKAATIIMKEYGGRLPADYDSLLRLPGIGSYTAGAISSIAFGIPVPCVDGNVLRVLARLRLDGEDILKENVKKRARRELSAVMPPDKPGDFNQALMELGATVCLPTGMPKCETCPLHALCLAHASKSELDYPKRSLAKPRRVEARTILVIRDGVRAAIKKRPEKGLLAGMYEFPSLPGHKSMDEVVRYLKGQGLSPIRLTPLGASRHVFTHVEWDMIGYAVLVDELEPFREREKMPGGDILCEGEKMPSGEILCERENMFNGELLFLEPAKLRETYPIPSAFEAYAKYLDIR